MQPRVVVETMVVLRTQNILSPAARGSGPRGIATNAKFSLVQPCVVMIRTQNILSIAARGNGTRGSGRNANFSKSSRAR